MRSARQLLTVVLPIALGCPGQAEAQGTIRLQGTVSVNCTLAVADAQYPLDILGGETGRAVATVTETCNAHNYTVTISSLRGGRLVATEPSALPVPYRVTYDGRESDLATPLAVQRTRNSRKGLAATVFATVPATPRALAGTYADTLTVSIAAK